MIVRAAGSVVFLGTAPTAALALTFFLLPFLSLGCTEPSPEVPSPEVPSPKVPSPGEACPPVGPQAATSGPLTFELDGAVRPLGPGQRHIYPLKLESGDYVELWAVQLGTDLVATVHRPGGDTLELDSPTGENGAEQLVFVAHNAGEFRLEVRAFEDQPVGNYRAELRTRRPADAADRRRADAAERYRRGQGAVWQNDAELAEKEFQAALDLWGEAPEDRWWRIETLDRLGRLAAARRDPRATELHAEAARAAAELGSTEQEAMNLFFLGRGLRRSGQLVEARGHLERALELYRAEEDPYGQALTSDELGDVLQDLGELQKALESFESARELWRIQGRQDHEASVLNDLGHLAMDLGRLDRARDLLKAADAIWLSLGQSRQRAFTLDFLGQVEEDAGRLDEARRYLEQALELHGETSQGRAATLANLAQVLGSEGDRERARALYGQAYEIFVGLGDRRSAGLTWNNLASLASADGRFAEALDAAQKALDIFRDIGLSAGEAEAQHQLAKALRGLGRSHQAREHLAAAVRGFEALRQSARSPIRRAFFFAELQDRYDRYVDLLMELAEEDPSWAERAFEIHERRRARVLLDLLSAPRGDHPELEAERMIQSELNLVERRRASASPDELPELARRLRELTDRLAELRAQGAAVAAAEPLDVEDIRRNVLDADTVLLAYALGGTRSFLWIVDTEGILHSAELPAAAELEAQAQAAYGALALRPRREGRDRRRAALCRASRTLLGPLRELLAGPLAGRRLAIMADGALERLAFGALPLPLNDEPLDDDCSDSFLLESHEVVQLPSASMTAALRKRRAQGSAPPPSILMVADPVFGGDDPRSEAGQRRTAVGGSRALRRLPHTVREAKVVLRTAEAAGRERRALLGFNATKAELLGGGMGDFEILHFATHGLLDPEHPELSALALSQVNADGRTVDDRLYAHEIQALDLNARLVVLSACETALGPELRGEGLLGLTRAFLQAGADRLLVSLWNVDDAAGAELMERLYRHLWIEGLPAAAALRAAQLDLLASPHHGAPYFWAGFIVQGDWR